MKARLTKSKSFGWPPTLLAVGILLLLFAVVASTLEVLPVLGLGHRLPDIPISEWYSFVLAIAIALSLLVLYQASKPMSSRFAGDRERSFSRSDDLHLHKPPMVFWWVLFFALICILVIPILWKIGWLPTLHHPIFGPPRL